MTDLLVTMASDGSFTMGSDVGRIEEYCAKRLKIKLNSAFLAADISYYTLSFEPYSLSRKIITENIYKESDTADGIYYADGYIFCPVYDYIAVSSRVLVQLDAYETDNDGNVKMIIKSGIFTLEFAPSLTGDGMMLATLRPDVKFTENVTNAVNASLKTAAIDGKNIINGTVSGDKIKPYSLTHECLADGCVTRYSFVNEAVETHALADGCVTESKIKNASVTSDKIAACAVTSDKIPENGISTNCLADNAVTTDKLDNLSVTENKLMVSSVTTTKLRNRCVTPDKLDRAYLTQHQSLNGYATEDWVKEQAFVTDISMKADKTELPEKLSEMQNDVAVSYLVQNLTESEKRTARENIDAVKKESGKMLSSNDFTDEEKDKLSQAITFHQDISMKADISELSSVAFSGSYSDLKDLPDIESLSKFDDELKEKYNFAYNHALLPHAAADAEKNILESISLNGTDVEISEKTAYITAIDFVFKKEIFQEAKNA